MQARLLVGRDCRAFFRLASSPEPGSLLLVARIKGKGRRRGRSSNRMRDWIEGSRSGDLATLDLMGDHVLLWTFMSAFQIGEHYCILLKMRGMQLALL
jgi:hypothetical protein